MENSKGTRAENSRTFVYRGTLPAGLGLLVLAPAVLVFLSVAAAAVVGGTAAALVLPMFLRRRSGRQDDAGTITLDHDQYSRVDPDQRQLPRR